MDKNDSSEKLLVVICNLSVNSSVIILHMNLLTDKASQKKIYLLHFVDTSIVEYSIS